MSAAHWHKRYHSDALTGFMSLNLEERGAYQTILDLIYDRGGPIISNDRLLAGHMGVSLRKWCAIRDALIEKGKIAIEDGHITNRRAIAELENAAKTSRKRAENGSKGGHKSGETRKKPKENSESDQAELKRHSSYTRSQMPEAAKAAPRECARETDFSIIEFTADLCRDAGVPLPDQGAAERNRQTVEGWKLAGADLSLIRSTIAARSANLRNKPRWLSYFNVPIQEAMANRATAETETERMAASILKTAGNTTSSLHSKGLN